MSALAFLVHHRSVDLVGVTALQALRTAMGYGELLLSLRRDDAYILEGQGVEANQAWAAACLAQAHWFNPNKHRHAAYEAVGGAIEAASEGSAWPRPWLGRMITTDRPDLLGGEHEKLISWLGEDSPGEAGEFGVTLAAWDRESALSALPHGEWPSRNARVLRAQLWTAVLLAEDAEQAQVQVEALALSESRRKGLLIHPHMQGWATAGTLAGG